MTPTSGGSLYIGRVRHQRFSPKRHRLSYKVAYLLVDIDMAPRMHLRLLSLDRANLFSLRSSDYGSGNGATLRERIAATLRAHGFSSAGRIRLLTIPRLLGHAFNPVSLFFCDDAEGGLEAIIYEVHNTFGERHSYVIAAGAERPIVQEALKAFFVSPFLPMDMRYRFVVEPPGETVRLTILDYEGERVSLAASMALQRRPLDDGALLRLALSMPFLAVKILAGIHFEALMLWLKGLPVYAWRKAPLHGVSAGNPISGAEAD